MSASRDAPDGARPTALRALLAHLAANLVAGARLARGRALSAADFHAGTGMALVMLACAWCGFALAAWLEAGAGARFWVWGFVAEAARMHLWLATLALGAWLCGAGRGLALLIVVQLAAALPVWLFCATVEIAAERLTLDLDPTWTWLYLGSAFLWYCTLLWRGLVLLAPRVTWRHGLCMTLYAALLIAMRQWLPDSPLFYSADNEAPVLDVEGIYYRQDELLDAALSALAPQTEGRTDLYFVGFGAYAEQDVFMRETLAVRDIVARRLGLSDRSVTLVNNLATVDTLALANRHNLARVLSHLGRVMDRDDDVAVLFITSHGYEDASVAVEFGALAPNDLYPEDIREGLARAGIRYSVVIVSACYSGGFVDALASPDTIVMSASARDRSSFGCDAERDWTYFGEAYFAEAMQETTDFVAAFELAAARIAAREAAEGKPASRPQIRVGENLARHLAGWQPAVQPSPSR
ncbi:MAG: C13 family peptidase [Gammaproteobacteria bacterium]|nr:C13 family peptidase [Gammaproteobacteria bacterium]